jgi:tetratricopeptide (TPR) repeat protein
MKRLNVKLLAWLAASSVILVAGVYVLHGWQIKRTAAVLKREAEAAKKENDLELAVRKYGDYLHYSGGDPEAQVTYALLTAEIAEGPDATWRERRNAFNALDEALRRDPTNDEVRRKLLDYSLMFRLFGDAQGHAKTLLANAPKGGDPAKEAKLLTLLAISQVGIDKQRDAVDSLRTAIEKDPHAVDAYLYLAQLLRDKLEDVEGADAVAASMIKDNPEDAHAYLQHARYLQSSRRAVSAAEADKLIQARRNDIMKALELAPDNADATLMAAQVYGQDNNSEGAKKLLVEGVEKHPDDPRLVIALAGSELGQGKRQEAIEAVQVGLNKNPNDLNLRMYKIELELDKGALTDVGKEIDELERMDGVSRAIVDYLRARMLFAEKKWAEASRKLEDVRPLMPEAQQTGIDMCLGRCYEMLGRPDRQIDVYQRVLSVNPGVISAQIGLSSALVATGKFDEARKKLEAVLAAMGPEQFVANSGLRSSLISLLLDYNSKRPEKDQDWSKVNLLVEATVKAKPDAIETALLQAEVLARMNKLPEARKILEPARDKNPKSLEVWLALARLAEREGKPAEVLAVIDQAEKSLGDSAALRIVRVGVSSLIDDESAKKALAAAAQGIDKFTPEEQDRLWRALGMGYYRLKDTQQASQWWSKALNRTPTDLRLRLALFEIANHAGDDAAMQSQIDDLKKGVRGESAEVNYFDARRIVQLARAKDAKEPNRLLDQARGLLKRAAELRPLWAVVPRAQAEVDDLQNRRDDAITHLEQAVKLGDSDTAVLQRLVELLQYRGRDKDADDYIALMSARNPGDDDLALVPRAEQARRKKNLPLAIELAEKAVKQAPDDARTLLYLGQLYVEGGRVADAEKTMSLAVEKGSDLPLTWLALMKLLVDTGKTKEARELMDKVATKLPQQEAQLVQAQGFELLKDNEQAEALLRKVRDAKPDDLGLSRVLAMFLLRMNQIDKGRVELERILAATPATEADANHQAWANREMARVLISKNSDYDTAKKALQRLRQIKDKSVEDKVTMAAILAGRPDAASRNEAIQILEEMGDSLTEEGRYTLAILYDRVGKWTKCREQMLTLLSDEKQEKNAIHLAHFIELLLRHREVERAETWVKKLEELKPGEPLTIAARARWLVHNGQKEEGIALLRKLVPQPLPPQNVDRLAQVAKVMEELELYDAAETMYREYVALAPKNILVLAEFFGRRGRLKEAMDVCERALETASPEAVAQVSLTALRSQPKLLGAEEWARIDGWFKAGLAKKPDSLLLKLQQAEFYDLQGKSSLVEKVYRRLLDDPKLSRDQQALVMNNLAFLLAVQRKNGESAKFIEKAIDVMGPTSDLLDTQGMVLLSQDEVQQAIAKFQQALQDKPSGTKYFHLAQAHLKANDTASAADALKTAMQDYDLKLTDLGELEQPIYKRLVQELGVK